MLHRETLSPGALDLLTALCAHPAMEAFALAGGTSLALRFGHRRSEDLDFFTSDTFENETLVAGLSRDFDLDERRRGPTGVAGFISGVRVDLVKYRYAPLLPPDVVEGVRLMSLPDVAAMKLSAITNRGAKKDFHDLHMLIREIGLQALIDHYQAKFSNTDPMMMLRSLTYFADAEDTEEPESLTGITWPEVKREISSAVGRML